MNVVYFGIYPGRCYDFYATIVPPPPQFLIGFGRIRKLASVRNGGDESPQSTPWRRHCLQHVILWSMFLYSQVNLSKNYMRKPC